MQTKQQQGGEQITKYQKKPTKHIGGTLLWHNTYPKDGRMTICFQKPDNNKFWEEKWLFWEEKSVVLTH